MPPLPRPTRITVAAVIVAIGSGLAISTGVFALLAGGSAFGGPAASSRALFIVFPLLLTAAGACGLATARGLLRLEPWARTSILIFSVLLAFLGSLGTFFILSTKIPAPPGISPQEFDEIRKIVSVVYFLFLALGVWWLLEFNSPNMKAAFRGERRRMGDRASTSTEPRAGEQDLTEDPRTEQTWADQIRAGQIRAGQIETRPSGFARPSASTSVRVARPLSITVIGWYLLVGTASSAVQVLMGVPASIFGMTLAGPAASLLYLAMFAAQAYLGVGLLQLQPLSRILAVYFFLFGFVNEALFIGLPGREARLAAMVRALPSSMQPAPGAAPAMAWWLPLISAGIGTALPIWFLIKRKDAFAPPPSPPQQEQQ